MEKDWGQTQSKASIIYTTTALKVWLTDLGRACWKTYGGPIKRAKRRRKNSSWLRTYVVNRRSEVSVRSCKESTVCCSVTCGVEYWDCKTVITTISFNFLEWNRQGRWFHSERHGSKLWFGVWEEGRWTISPYLFMIFYLLAFHS